MTIGDCISVSYGVDSHLVRVIELKPADAVSLIDTELEVDLFIPSFVVSTLVYIHNILFTQILEG